MSLMCNQTWSGATDVPRVSTPQASGKSSRALSAITLETKSTATWIHRPVCAAKFVRTKSKPSRHGPRRRGPGASAVAPAYRDHK